MSFEVLPTAAELHGKQHLKGLH